MSETIKIPTAEEYLIENCQNWRIGYNTVFADYICAEDLINFTRLHVKAALEAAVKSIVITVEPDKRIKLNAGSILNAYPDDKIL